jgi:hypothetical protein
MLKELNRLAFAARRQSAAWRRWHRKLPHNRVSRPRIRDKAGRVIGYGDPVPIPEPAVTSPFCRMVQLPSGRTDVFVTDCGIEAAYRQARQPRQSSAEVVALPLTEDAIRRMFEKYCR